MYTDACPKCKYGGVEDYGPCQTNAVCVVASSGPSYGKEIQ